MNKNKNISDLDSSQSFKRVIDSHNDSIRVCIVSSPEKEDVKSIKVVLDQKSYNNSILILAAIQLVLVFILLIK